MLRHNAQGHSRDVRIPGHTTVAAETGRKARVTPRLTGQSCVRVRDQVPNEGETVIVKIRQVGLASAAVVALVAAGTGTATANPNSAVLGLGSTGSGVVCVQQAYNFVTGPGLAVDGTFGPATEAATKDFQRFSHLQVDGIVGKQTGDVIGFAVDQKAGNGAWHGSGNGAWHGSGCGDVVPSTS
jgi:peptidoglycan hydrolase-like protein with peptidoglycan-binding domain